MEVYFPYNEIKGRMKKWRKKNFPKQPRTIKEMGEKLLEPGNEKLRSYGPGVIEPITITDSDGNDHMILIDRELINKRFKNLKNAKIFIDGTFQTTPKLDDIYQLLTVMMMHHNHVSVLIQSRAGQKLGVW